MNLVVLWGRGLTWEKNSFKILNMTHHLLRDITYKAKEFKAYDFKKIIPESKETIKHY